jgi:hypothetical protein
MPQTSEYRSPASQVRNAPYRIRAGSVVAGRSWSSDADHPFSCAPPAQFRHGAGGFLLSGCRPSLKVVLGIPARAGGGLEPGCRGRLRAGLVMAAAGRPCAAEGFPYRAVRPIANRHLVVIGAALIPEPLNVHDDYGPVNGQPLILHRPHPARTKAEAKL